MSKTLPIPWRPSTTNAQIGSYRNSMNCVQLGTSKVDTARFPYPLNPNDLVDPEVEVPRRGITPERISSWGPATVRRVRRPFDSTMWRRKLREFLISSPDSSPPAPVLSDPPDGFAEHALIG